MKELKLPAVQSDENLAHLRNEIRTFIQGQADKGVFEAACDSWLTSFSEEFSKALGEHGFIGMTWPKEYGGYERTSIERHIVIEELLAAGAPVAAHWIADRQSGPLLLKFGTEEQKEYYLKKIAKGECYFSIGLSEPNAGSDLAAIRTQAKEVDGGWLVNGSKIWTSGAHKSHYMITLCRTSPYEKEHRHAGMSQFIIDLHAPNITIRPIQSMTGDSHFNEIFFEDVFVPNSALVGTLGDGWSQGMAELAYERSGPERILSTFPLLEQAFIDLKGKRDEQGIRALIPIVTELATLRQMSLSIADLLQQGVSPTIAAALVKDMGTAFEQKVAEEVRVLLQLNPSLFSTNVTEKLMAQAVLQSPGFTLRGGTTEILRGIVAKGVLSR